MIDYSPLITYTHYEYFKTVHFCKAKIKKIEAGKYAKAGNNSASILCYKIADIETRLSNLNIVQWQKIKDVLISD